MISSYNTDISLFHNLLEKSPVTQYLFKSLLPTVENSPHCNNILSNIFDSLLITLNSTSFIDSTYFSSQFPQLKYELAWDIYNKAYLSLTYDDKNQNKVSLKNCITNYVNCPSTPDNATSIQQNCSRYTAQMRTDELNWHFPSSHIKKMELYADCVCYPAMQKNIFLYTPLSEDIVFNILKYPKSVYCSSSENNIYIGDFYDILDEYLMYTNFLENKKSKLDMEHSAYIFDRFYYIIQYLNCCYSYLQRPYTTKTMLSKLWPLFEYSKLYDTNYRSLTNYIINKYENIINNIYSESKEKEYMFLDMQFLNTFLLPIINLTIKEILFLYYDGDIEKIKKDVSSYIFKILELNSPDISTFRGELKNIKEKMANLTYPSKNAVTDSSAKHTGNTDHLFNQSMYYNYYRRELQDYIYNCSVIPQTYCSIENCYTLLQNYYNNTRDFLSTFSLKTCKESTREYFPPYLLNQSKDDSQNAKSKKNAEQKERDRNKKNKELIRQTTHTIAKKLLSTNVDHSIIRSCTELSEEDLIKIQSSSDWND